jgi:predicted glycosyltransferase
MQQRVDVPLTAALHPGRVLGVVSIATWAPFLTPPSAVRAVYDFDKAYDSDEGWAKDNRHYWLRDWRGYAEFFFAELLPEPHSSKQHEDMVSWAMDTSAETNLLFVDAPFSSSSRAETEAVLARVSCPVLAIHGREDCCQPCGRSEQVAALTGGDLLMLDGAGHLPIGREPVVVNRAIREFADRFRSSGPVAPARQRVWTRPLNRPKRVLYVSSPIGLGHARRDLAIADELRRLKPGLEVHWLAQHPVTELLRRRSELIHPASAFLASESGHIESEAAEHDLHAFQAVRSMDEILVANFMVFAELTENEPFDLWVGDEARDIDYFLHENPELKRAPYAWMTDFVGWLPMPDGGPREQALTADYNAEMIEQIARFPALRDRSVFVGNPDDVVPHGFGDGLPAIRDWVERNYRFSGYVSGSGPETFADRGAIRAELGYRPGEQVCVATVGGSGVGTDLLRRAVAAYPAAQALVPGLRMVVVTGPRIDPDSLTSRSAADGLEVRGYVPDLYRHLAACDLAVVQGGLTTTMELTASGRPFIYVPLRHHFEQNFHVRYRLDRYGAGRCLDYDQTGPEALAQAIAAEIGRPVSYRPVETDGAARAAALLAELV